MGAYPDSQTMRISVEQVREYLRPPGDSSKLQPPLDEALTSMEEAARADMTVKSVIIEIDPALG